MIKKTMKYLIEKANSKSTDEKDENRTKVKDWEPKDKTEKLLTPFHSMISGTDFKHTAKLPVLKRPEAQHSDTTLKDSTPTKTQEHGKGPTFATRGGGVAYHNVRSKIAKYANGEPKVVTVEREKMMEKLGKDPGYNVVAMHKTGGSHVGHSGDPFTMGTRSENTSDSNKARASKKFTKKFGR